MENNTEKHPSEIHQPVMLEEVLDFLNPQPGEIAVDGTLGMGGHAEAVLKRIGPTGQLIGFDRDIEALSLAEKRLLEYKNTVFVHDNVKAIKNHLQKYVPYVDCILLDCGISSFQVDQPERGFSFQNDGPLDMRMNRDESLTAYDIVNTYNEKELAQIFKEYGEERFSFRIAKAIVRSRDQKAIESTSELAQIIYHSVPWGKDKRPKIHPATRSFQALRIVVNKELESLAQAIEDCLDVLNENGRMAVIAFHSLEDRIVKNIFRDRAKDGPFELIVKKPLRPGDEEIEQNPRARSARLRGIMKLKEEDG